MIPGEKIISFRRWVQNINDVPSSAVRSGRPRKGVLAPTIMQGWKRRRAAAWDASQASVLRVAYLIRDGKCHGIQANTVECLCYALGGHCFYKGTGEGIVPMRGLMRSVPHQQPRFSVARNERALFWLPIWRMPMWALPEVLELGAETIRKVHRGQMNVSLLAHQKWAWSKHLLLYCSHPLYGTCRVQLPGDGFDEWAKSIEARRRDALGYYPKEEL